MYFIETLCFYKAHMTFLGTVIGLLQVNEYYMQIFLLLPASLHKLLYQENRLHSQSPCHKIELVFGDVDHSP
jgi:hypothetical protein